MEANNTSLQVQQNTETGEFNNLPVILNSAPEILMQNQTSKSKATEAYLTIENLITDNGMSDFYDNELAKFVEKGKKTITSMNDRRKPVTQMIDLIKKEFTSLESDLKSTVDKAQSQRNAYATEKMKIKQEEDRQAALRLAKEKEIIEYRKSCEIAVSSYFTECASKIKSQFLNDFNSLTLENIDKAGFESTSSNFDTYFYKGINLTFPDNSLLDKDTLDSIRSEFIDADYSAQKAQFKAEIQSQLRELVDKIPSKKAELQTLALADAAETERLLKEKEAREKDEADRIAKEAENKRKEAETAASVKAAGEQAAVLVDAQVGLFEAPKVVESYEIKLTNIAGYLMLIQFWFEKEGKSLPQDKFEKFTFARAKAFCENYAKKNDEFIKNPTIIYEPKYKAK
nr:MAG TPA: hypothetical protein [Caudoviricetes sp.]